MRDQAKPLRTMLYVPANKEDWVRKAPKYGADALILDIEDSVPLDEKQNAREIVSRINFPVFLLLLFLPLILFVRISF